MQRSSPRRRPAGFEALRSALACGAVGAAAAVATLATAPVRAAGADPALPDQVLVQLRSGAALPGLLQRHGLSLVARLGARPIVRLQAAPGTALAPLVERLALDSDVLMAEPNRRLAAPEARKNNVWAIGSADAYAAQWAYDALRLPQAWTRSTGAGVRVAVLDTGLDPRHPVFAGRLGPGWDFVDGDADPSEPAEGRGAAHGHGTHVAGLIAKAAPGAQLMPLRVLDDDGVGDAWTLGAALLQAIDPDGDPATDDGAQVVNLSLGSLERIDVLRQLSHLASCAFVDDGQRLAGFDDPGYEDDRRRCAARPGAVLIIAAGNQGDDTREYPAAESAYGKLAVAATGLSGVQGASGSTLANGASLASFSSRGSWVDVAAPGERITSAMPGGGYASWSGTSMAAPLVAGVAALLRAAEPALSAEALVRRIARSGAPICDQPMRRVDAWAALVDARATDRCR